MLKNLSKKDKKIMPKPITVFVDFESTKDCTNPDSFGYICVKCNKCGRFNKEKSLSKKEEKMKEVNQSKEILDYIKKNSGCCTRDIVKGTGWNRYVIEMVIKLTLEKNIIKEVGRTEWDDPQLQFVV